MTFSSKHFFTLFSGFGLLLFLLSFISLPLVNCPPPTTVKPESSSSTTTTTVPKNKYGVPLSYIEDIKKTMKTVPAGEYMIGTNDTSFPERTPEHKVSLDKFQMMEREISNDEFKKIFIDNNGYGLKEIWDGEGWKWKDKNGIKQPAFWTDSRVNQKNQPILGISWYEAMAFATMIEMRLPTEQEWEAAARGKDAWIYPWGNEFIEGYAIVTTDAKKVKTPEATGKNTSGKNPFGIMDLVGNVYEYTSSVFMIYPGADKSIKESRPEMDGFHRVARGSSYKSASWSFNLTQRWVVDPAKQNNEEVGFRLVRDITE